MPEGGPQGSGTPAAVNDEVEKFVRPQTFPLAIRMAKPGEPLPGRVRRPAADMGIRVAICQSFSIARRYGWGFGRDDLSCPLAKTAFGFETWTRSGTQGNHLRPRQARLETALGGSRTRREFDG